MSLDYQSILEATTMAIVTQGGPSMDPDTGSCQYRGQNGFRCAMGHLMDDRHYRTSMEGEPVCDDERVIEAISKTLGVDLSRKDISFLYELQYAHDDSSGEHDDEDFFKEWEQRLREVCEKYKLRFPEELL